MSEENIKDKHEPQQNNCVPRPEYSDNFNNKSFPHVLIKKLKDLGRDFKNETPEERLGALLGFCSCIEIGILEKMWKIFLLLLKTGNDITHIKEKTSYDYDFIQVTMSIFDAIGLVEHGTSVRGCWLSIEKEQAEEFFGVKLDINYID